MIVYEVPRSYVCGKCGFVMAHHKRGDIETVLCVRGGCIEDGKEYLMPRKEVLLSPYVEQETPPAGG